MGIIKARGPEFWQRQDGMGDILARSQMVEHLLQGGQVGVHISQAYCELKKAGLGKEGSFSIMPHYPWPVLCLVCTGSCSTDHSAYGFVPVLWIIVHGHWGRVIAEGLKRGQGLVRLAVSQQANGLGCQGPYLGILGLQIGNQIV